ncbi:DMT family transporter [Xylanibacter rodentium]|jgi:drug/metabolite transporter (DMT)-like permease|uniref:EamA family transporter n=1 Tax=Xylanibacter rodentium TaxID=2736289 RepID=A0ABX2AV98_9BACT|nr:EamA family transporter [Xylanibacter rodentium]NPE11359.1 EamA family transporter [Prevotella sp. PJ1A]NPE14061.1 EamA family transporter [Xylanibacter rodentium]NPE39823.1 EamA family transporter [Prevotella sp. PCJ2]
MNTRTKGAVCGVTAAVAYGTNPLFSLALYDEGMDVESVLFYRFAIAAAILAAVLRLRGVRLGICRREIAPLLLAGIIFAMSSQTLYQSFLYMDAGVACSILFVYPILVAVIMTVFFHERASLLTYGCIATATAGIALLYQGDGDVSLSTTGLLLVVLSSLCYSVYIVGVDHSVLSRVPSARMTLWVLVAGALMFFVFTGFGTRLQAVPSTIAGWGNVVGVALVPTIIPILFINVSIKSIGPTYSAIIGALEPVTALTIGVMVFDERLTGRIILGALLIFVSVTFVVARPLLVKFIPHGHVGARRRHNG